ncbi:putative sulfate exporter family transporter [Haloplanus halobius]|uniref:putative sulfate exporter family transporter n=1 Tax=Haloplanus halobius TaxID=2934938 RepID=UPI00200DEB7A
MDWAFDVLDWPAAAGFAHSEVAGQWATLTKLTRNAMIGVVALSDSFYYTRQNLDSEASIGQVWGDFPKFLIGFLLLAPLANLGNLPSAVIDSLSRASDLLFLLAFAGLGFEIQFDEMRDTGIVPIVVVGSYLVISSIIAYSLVQLLF